jgi:DNA-binding NarL/FixJ family response regulator
MTAQAPGADRPRVVLVDDHAMFRAGVRSEIGAAVDIVAEASGTAEAVALIVATQPDVVLLDVHLPDGGGPAVLRGAQAGAPDVRYLALSVSDAAEDVIAVIRAGAQGYVTKSISGPDLIDAVRRVADGDVVFSPRLAGFVLDAFRESGIPGQPAAAAARGGSDAVPETDLDRLTPREQEVMRLLARGYSYREIAGQLFISIKTVETHASNVLRKLQLSSRHQLTRWASDRRIV